MGKNDLYGKSIEEIATICKNREQELVKSFNYLIGGILLGGTLSVAIPDLFPVLFVGDLFLFGRFILKEKESINCNIIIPDVCMNSLEYQNVWVIYQQFLKEFTELSKKLNWDNEMKLFAGYCYLLKQGYLSLGHEFYYSKGCDFIFALTGCTVFSGVGDCKHINSMLNDMLMKKLKIQNREIKNDEKVSDCNESLTIRIIDMLIRKQVQTNHMVVLFKDENHSYVMDACNDTLFFSNDRNQLYQGSNEFFCRYDIFSNAGQKEKLSKIMLPTDLERMEVLMKDYYQVWNMCFECTDIFEHFYLEHKELYADVVDKKKILIREFDKNRRS